MFSLTCSVNAWEASPYVRYSLSVLVVSCPDGDFISFCSDVDYSPAYIIAVVVKGLTDEAQQL